MSSSSPITFSIDSEQVAKLNKWIITHDLECGIRSQGAIGGKYSYVFIPNVLGQVTKVVCACGREVDLTRYESW